MSALATLIRMTLLELWRRRVSALPLLVLLFIVLAALLPPHELTVNGHPVAVGGRDLAGVAFQVFQFFGIFLGLGVGSGLMANEIERGTVLLLAIKPLSRWQLVLGKGLGGFVFVAVWFVLWAFAFALTTGFHSLGMGAWPLFIGGLAGTVTGWLFVAISLCFSTRLPAVGAMGAGVFAWILAGAAPQMIRFEQVPGYEMVGHVARAIAWLVPSDAIKNLPFAWAFGPLPTLIQLAPLAAVPLWLLLAALAFERRSLN